MTVAENSGRIKAACNGILSSFPFTMGIADSGDIRVVLSDSDGNESTLVEGVNYYVSCVNNCSSGGTVVTTETDGTTLKAYAAGYHITIAFDVPLSQESDFTEGMATLYEVFEQQLDKQMRAIQMLREELNRCLSLPVSQYASNPFSLPAVSANALLGWNSAGTNLANFSTATVTIPQIDHIGNYGDDLAAAVAAIGNNLTTLMINKAISLAGSSVITPITLALWFTDGGRINGTGVETLTINRLIPTKTRWVGDNLTIIINGDVYSSNFPEADLGARINRAVAAVTGGHTINVTADEWFDTVYSTGIVLSGTGVKLSMPGIGDSSTSNRAHYTGTGEAIKTLGSRCIISGGFSIDFTGNINTGVNGVVLASSDSVINDQVTIASSPGYGILFGHLTADVYGNTFTGIVRVTNSTKDDVRFQKLGSGDKPNRNFISNLVITNSNAAFSAESVTLTQAAGVATATQAGHPYVIGDVVLIAAADQADYNGSWVVRSTVPGVSYTFNIDNDSAVSPATGTITATKQRVGINFVDGHSNFIALAYPQVSATGAWGVVSSESNPNTFGVLTIEGTNSVLGDDGTIQSAGGENFSAAVREVNGGSVSLNDSIYSEPQYSRPGLLRPRALHHAYRENTTMPSIYTTDGTGATEPFDESGNLVIEGGTNLYKGIYISAGGVGTQAWRIALFGNSGIKLRPSGAGDGFWILDYDGSPEGVKGARFGSLCINTGNTGGTYPFYVKRSASGNTGWEGQGTVYP
jgi:hypothetical protein